MTNLVAYAYKTKALSKEYCMEASTMSSRRHHKVFVVGDLCGKDSKFEY
jgi:hypothetical protein